MMDGRDDRGQSAERQRAALGRDQRSRRTWHGLLNRPGHPQRTLDPFFIPMTAYVLSFVAAEAMANVARRSPIGGGTWVLARVPLGGEQAGN